MAFTCRGCCVAVWDPSEPCSAGSARQAVGWVITTIVTSPILRRALPAQGLGATFPLLGLRELRKRLETTTGQSAASERSVAATFPPRSSAVTPTGTSEMSVLYIRRRWALGRCLTLSPTDRSQECCEDLVKGQGAGPGQRVVFHSSPAEKGWKAFWHECVFKRRSLDMEGAINWYR